MKLAAYQPPYPFQMTPSIRFTTVQINREYVKGPFPGPHSNPPLIFQCTNTLHNSRHMTLSEVIHMPWLHNNMLHIQKSRNVKPSNHGKGESNGRRGEYTDQTGSSK